MTYPQGPARPSDAGPGRYPPPQPVQPPPVARPLTGPVAPSPDARATYPGGRSPFDRPLQPSVPLSPTPSAPSRQPTPGAPYPAAGGALPPHRPVQPPPAVARQAAPAPGAISPQWTTSGGAAAPWARPPAGTGGGPVTPKRSHAGVFAGLGLAAVAVVLLGVIGVAAGSLHRSGVQTQAGYTHSTTTSDSSTEGGDPPSSAPSTGSSTGSARPSATSLAANPLFGPVPAIPANCRFDPYQHTVAGQQKLIRQGVACLNAMWQPILAADGIPFTEPKLAFPTGSEWSSRCGSVSSDSAAAFYCSGDQTLYMPWNGLQSDSFGPQPGVYLAVLAHEYGHHVQYLAGIMRTADEQRYTAGENSDLGLELSRRLELEAQCFSGFFFGQTQNRGSVTLTIVQQGQDHEDRGDHTPGMPRDHGTDEHSSSWWDLGLHKRTTSSCDTWAAGSADVA